MKGKIDLERIVTTAFGKTAKRKECRFIHGSFYKMNEECFKFSGRWYRINSGYLVQMAETKKWVLKNDPEIICGLVLGDLEDVSVGYFKRNLFKNIPIDTASIPKVFLQEITFLERTAYALDMKVVNKMGFKEDISTGIFMSPKKASKKISIGGNYNFDVQYNFEHTGDSIKKAYSEYIKTIVPKSQYADLLNDLSFGWEFETTDGFVHPRHLITTSLVPLRDGSISGFEYATCPLSGAQGLDTTIRAGKILSKYTTKNISCSLHLHIGNVPIGEKYLTTFWRVCKIIEKDIFAMFPVSMKNTSKYKGRDYCRALPSLGTINSENIINWISGRDHYYEEYFRGLGEKTHPNDNDGNHKWNVEQR